MSSGEATVRSLDFVLVTMEGSGNTPAPIALVAELVRRGHRVRVLGHENLRRRFEEAGGDFRLYERTPVVDSNVSRSQQEEVDFVFRRLVFEARFGHDLLAELERRPADVVLIDRVLYGAMAAAESVKVPSATLFYTLFGAIHLGEEGRVLARAAPEMNAVRAEFGLGSVETPLEQIARLDLSLVFAPEFFDDEFADLPANVRYVGPLVPEKPGAEAYESPWPATDRRPLIVVSLSTGSQNQSAALQNLLDATARMPVRLLMTVGNALDPGELEAAANARVERFVPHDQVLSGAALVVTHAGLGTVMAALRHGVPLLCLPMGRDQHENGRRVEELGFGRTVPSDSSVGTLRAAISDVLGQLKYKKAIRKLGQGVDPEKGVQEAADLVEGLVVL